MVMLHVGAGHSSNCQIILKLLGYHIFCNNLWHKNNFKQMWRYQRYYSMTLQIGGKARVILHLGVGHTSNCQIILTLFGYDIFCNNLHHKHNFKQLWKYQRH